MLSVQLYIDLMMLSMTMIFVIVRKAEKSNFSMNLMLFICVLNALKTM